MLAFATHHIVNPRKRTKLFKTHLSVKIGSPKDYPNIWIHILNQFRQRQARDVLVKGRGKANHVVLIPFHRSQCPC